MHPAHHRRVAAETTASPPGKLDLNRWFRFETGIVEAIRVEP